MVTRRFGQEAVIGKGMIRERAAFAYGNGLDKVTSKHSQRVKLHYYSICRNITISTVHIGILYDVWPVHSYHNVHV